MSYDEAFWRTFREEQEPKLLRAVDGLRIDSLTAANAIPGGLRLYANDRIAIYYGPFGLGEKTDAKVVLVGLTPGFSQTRLGYQCFQEANGDRDAFRAMVSERVAFAGPMRTCLVRYLDEIGVQSALGLDTSDDLFGREKRLLTTCSLLRYPVFTLPGMRNFSGSGTAARDPFVASMIRWLFKPFICSQSEQALIVPLGKYPSLAIEELCSNDPGLAARTLIGFPHTSGSNGHRATAFARGKEAFTSKVERWKRCLR